MNLLRRLSDHVGSFLDVSDTPWHWGGVRAHFLVCWGKIFILPQLRTNGDHAIAFLHGPCAK